MKGWTVGLWVVEEFGVLKTSAMVAQAFDEGIEGPLEIAHMADLPLDERRATARLISAAPELYDALESAVACYYGADEVWIDEARAALNKARGEQQ